MGQIRGFSARGAVRVFRLNQGGFRRILALGVVLLIITYAVQSILIAKSSEGSLLVTPTSTPSAIYRNDDEQISEFTRADNHSVSDGFCERLKNHEPCEEPYFPFRVISGRGSSAPIVCWNKRTLRLSSLSRGSVSLVEISSLSETVVTEKSYQAPTPLTYSSILAQIRFTRNDSYLLAISWDGIPFTPNLSNGLKLLGTLINPKFFGEQIEFYAIGQRGLLPGRGISDVQKFNVSPVLDRSGCVAPLALEDSGAINKDLANANPGFLVAGQFVVGSHSPNCGMPSACPENKIPVHVYTGKDHNDPPKMCINGYYVFENKINNGGRGMNIAVVHGPTGDVLRVANYDTWGTDSTMMEVFLADLQSDEMAVVFTHDEASTKLSDLSRNLFFELGSHRIHDLRFRSSWFMVGQKGIKGFSGYEKLNLGEKTFWAEVIDERFCMERRLIGHQARPDPLPETRNFNRLRFCQKYSGYGRFCNSENSLAPLVPTKLADVALVDSPLFNDQTAVLILASKSTKNLRLQLETLIGQPGINQRQVRLALQREPDVETKALVNLFGFIMLAPFPGLEYRGFMIRAIDAISNELKSKYLLVIEEDMLLSPDFLHYFAKLEPIFDMDSNVKAIGAWNPNGFLKTSGDITKVLRVESFPRAAFLIPRTFWESRGTNEQCCMSNSSDGWFSTTKPHSLIPDVSRVAVIPRQQNSVEEKRMFSRATVASVVHPAGLTEQKYDQEIVKVPAEERIWYDHHDCADLKADIAVVNSSVMVGFRNEDDVGVWKFIAKCFELPSFGGLPYNLYKGTLSLVWNGRSVTFLSPSSPLVLDQIVSQQSTSNVSSDARFS